MRILDSDPNAPPIVPLPGAPIDGDDRIAEFTIDGPTLELLVGEDDSAIVFMRVFAYTGPLQNPIQSQTSHEEGAGAMFSQVDDPGSVYVSQSAPEGECACSFERNGRAPLGSLIWIFGALALYGLRRFGLRC